MSSDATASAPIISLPKGGGALQGIGETFAPDLHTGTGNFSVPLALPAGRNGFQPQLALVYSTGNGNGPFGMGWGLSIPGVARKTSRGVPRYDAADTFLLSGAEDLVPVSEGPPGVTRYRPRTEGLFARIDHHRNSMDDYWELRSKDGLVSSYGTAGTAGSDAATVADPTNRRRVFAWKLARTTDPFGNRIEYEYERDLGVDPFHRWDQLYLRQIRYADYESGTGETTFLITVDFVYGQTDRPDPFSENRAGFEIRTRRRCNRIEIRSHAERERLIRTYDLRYLDQRPELEGMRPLNGVSLLSEITVVGHDDEQTESLPPLTFGYTRFDPEKRDFFPVRGSDLPAVSLGHPDLELADLSGDGLPDILEMNGTVRSWRNRGGGRYDVAREMRTAPAGVAFAEAGVQLIDADGDGRVDLLVSRPPLAGYFPLQFDGTWDERSFTRYRTAPSFDLEDPEVRLVDLDGDGVTDAIRSGTRLECFFNHPEDGWSRTRSVERRAVDEFPNVSFSDERVRFADMTGDGLQDIVLVHDGHIEYWPSFGHGDWGARVSMRQSPRFPSGYDPKRILMGDVDGDGVADLVYVDDARVMLWINQSGNGWSDPVDIRGTPRVSDMDAVRLADILGSGVSGVLWSADADGLTRDRMFFADFTGAVKPYLLDEMDNHLGAITRVTYAPSTRFYLEDEQRPATRWKTSLPFPVQVVARVDVEDAHSHGRLTTEYRYHHGYWDGVEREFRGFGRVDKRDTEVFAEYYLTAQNAADAESETLPLASFSPPTESRTWFHQGPVADGDGRWAETDFSAEFWPGDPQVLLRPRLMSEFLAGLPRRVKRDALRTLRGSALRTELYALDGTSREDRPYTVTEHLSGLREEAPPGADTKRLHIFFPHPLVQRTTQWERGNEPLTQFAFTSDYDEFGQAREQTQIACARGWRSLSDEPATPYLATRTTTAYGVPTSADSYIRDRVAATATYEIRNDGSQPLLELAKTAADSPALEVAHQTVSFFDGPAFQGLPFGQVGSRGALVRTESLVLTEALLHDGYRSGANVLDPPEAPPYLAPIGTSAWPTEYPQPFRDLLPLTQSADATRPGLHITPVGYGFSQGGSGFARGYYVASERKRYDFQVLGGNQRGLVLASRDPLGRDSLIAYDPFELLVVSATDPAGLTVTATQDYRVFQPVEVVDPNGNRSSVAFTPLGLLAATVTRGKTTEHVGDTPEVPGSRLFYDFGAFVDRGEPVSVRTVRRVHHVNDQHVPLPDRDATIESIEYSDGFGRLLQTRTQAADVSFGETTFGNGVLPADQAADAGDAVGQRSAIGEPPVVVSGWQVYDNKGQVAQKYEPFFSSEWAYAPPGDVQLGRKAVMVRDPRGQVVRTVNPDASEQRVIYGVPVDLAVPEQFAPTPWEVYTYDANDNAGRTHAADPKTRAYEHHWNTPASIVIDALGRTVDAVERNRARHEPGEPLALIEDHRTRSRYDIRGNLLTVNDPLGRVAFRHVYDFANHPLRIESIDAGIRRTVLDAIGNTIEARDSKGALRLSAHDVLNRPARLWARDDGDSIVTLRERRVYGDSDDVALTRDQAAAANLLGKLHGHHDEAGLVIIEANDFKGNSLEKVRQVISDAAILAVFESSPSGQVRAFRVDWETADAEALLDANRYRTSLSYDALGRVTAMRYPEDVDGERKVLQPVYNRAGALERVVMDGSVYVDHIAYNAKGQRSLIAYGNGVMTRHAFDTDTFRLIRLRSERYTIPADRHYHPTGAALQDLAYEFDLAGNIVVIHDRTPESGVPNTVAGPDALDRAFAYDPLYRLLSATGREHATPPAALPWVDEPKSQDPTLTRAYSEHYDYDPAGNMLRMQHQAGAAGSVTRTFGLEVGNNRLATITAGGTAFGYAYDTNGSLISEAASRHLEWDHSDRMRIYRTQAGDAEASLHAQYLYDSGGQRVKKVVRRQGGKVDVTVYIDGFYEHHRAVDGNALQENNSLHIMDDASRIALRRVGAPFPDDGTPALKYHLGDHLGSSTLVVDEAGAVINREEYTPYGATSFGSFARKRYRFTGRERDEESGLDYHGARYYAPWLTRWVSCDPKGMAGGRNLFTYVENRPSHLIDPSGLEGERSDYPLQPEYNLAEALPEPPSAPSDLLPQVKHEVPRQASAAKPAVEPELSTADPEEVKTPDRMGVTTVDAKPPAFGQPFADHTVAEILNYYLDQALEQKPATAWLQMHAAMHAIIKQRNAVRGRGKDLNYAAADHYLNTRGPTNMFGYTGGAALAPPILALTALYDKAKQETLPLGWNINVTDPGADVPSDPDPRVLLWSLRGIADEAPRSLISVHWRAAKPGDVTP